MPEPDKQILVSAEGQIKFVWDDELAALLDAGLGFVDRASFVEPGWTGEWYAHLQLSNGPILGPFRLRGDAVTAEREWIERQLIEGG